MKKTNRLIDYFAMNIQQQEKNKSQGESWEAIAKKAYELIKEKTTIFLDHSPEATALAEIIAVSKKKHLTIVTNSILISKYFYDREDIVLIYLGGEINHEENSFGWLSTKILSTLSIDQSFLGVDGIDFEYGYSVRNEEEFELKLAAIQHSKSIIILADSSKFGIQSFHKIAGISGIIDYVVTEDQTFV